jgi:phosphoribosylaminoimidazolecarboxamide formyltransferase/IMP cyclohydrolase
MISPETATASSTATKSSPTAAPDAGLRRITRALLSVTDKTGLVDFARALEKHGVELVSTGGTAKALRDAGLEVRDISDLTGFPEMLDGRVKTLHPKVHGGILHMRGNAEHVAAVEAHEIQPIDMVVVNLYAFEKTASRPGVAFSDVIENIDIGGPSMVRSAAKNFEDVAIVTAAADYAAIADEIAANSGSLTRSTRWRLAKAAFATTAAYDAGIATALETIAEPAPHGVPAVFEKDAMPESLRIVEPRKTVLRYGENPHQRAALYVDGSARGVANAKVLQGKELSYNNLVDLDACWELVNEFAEPAVAIIKHTNPCGAATGGTVLEAYKRALESDPVSAFGGVIGINREVDGVAAEEIAKLFVEAIVAPGYSADALARFGAKKNLRLLEIASGPGESRVIKQVSGGFLVQDADRHQLTEAELKVVTKRAPTAEEMRALRFAWSVCKHVKSNAIVYARFDQGHGQTVGVGAGQMSRVDAAKFGAMKAALPLAGTVAASDAYFPFADGLETVVAAGATAVIQPGGSVRDAEVIDAADRLGIAMVFTGVRHFRHG